MTLPRLHRQLAVGMALVGLVAFAAGAGRDALSGVLAAVVLLAALVWNPPEAASRWMERLWGALAVVFVIRALIHVVFVRSDVVIPVVDLLLVLLCAEALRSTRARNEGRIYALAFALLLAATAYRPGLLFGAAFVTFVVLATAAMSVGHLRGQAEERGTATPPLGRSAGLGILAVATTTLVVSGLVFVTFPRVSRGWVARGGPPATSVAGFSEEVSLGSHGSTIYSNPQIVLRVEFSGDTLPRIGNFYWRGRSFDHFDGVRWSRSSNPPPSAASRSWYADRWRDPVLNYQIYGTRLDSRVLFALHPVVGVDMDPGLYPYLDNSGDFGYGGRASLSYRAASMAGPPGDDALRGSEEGRDPGGSFFLQLPPNLSPDIPSLADSLTAGLETRIDRARALETWFHREFAYTRDLPPTAREATLEHFIFQRRAGHCEYFSTAMVMMLRSLGIPSREVNGFLGGQWNEFGKYLAVTQNEAHSWVEVWFPRYGWVTFDPTPAGSGTVAARSWAWPGRFLFDGLQHRWNKWVLDYSTDDQAGLLRGLSRTMEPQGGGAAGTSTGGLRRVLLNPALLGGVGILAVLVLFLGLSRRRSPVSEPSALYLKLRRSYESRDPDLRGLGPLAFAREVNRRGHPGAGEVDRLVDRYLRIRFGGKAFGPEERRAMRQEVREARARMARK